MFPLEKNAEFTTVLFDMDGTLSDSFPGVSGGILYALEKLGYECPPRESLKDFMGPPLLDQFMRRFKMDEDTAAEAVRLYREYYPVKGINEQSPMEGAEETVRSLKERGMTVCVATSKPLKYTEIILRNFGIEKYFDVVVGATFDGTLSGKPDIIAEVLKRTGAAPEECLMVGDRCFDVEGAHACGVRCAGVLCGYGSLKEFDSCGADYILNGLTDVLKIAG
ncbi:MAG: HAD-IA family hydrolase [Oscillospiraceae bacterium]|nr:HAD-IA family hydrolase [Oscillospiraceae bacterium]